MTQDDQIDEAALERLIPAFYARVRGDADIGPLFNAAVDDWPRPSRKARRLLVFGDADDGPLQRVARSPNI